MNVFLPACSRTRERGITADPFSESPIGAPCASASAMAVAACSLGLNGQRLYGIVAYPGRASVAAFPRRSEEHTSELQSLMRISYAVFCLKKKIIHHRHTRSKYSAKSTN